MTLTSRDRLNPDGLPIADAPVLEKGRVLLLDEDPCLHEVIHDFLAGHGYTVVAVRNCDDGVQEVLAGDFAVILCDLVAPGETFYRTVERIRPWFCPRFIFMADSRADVKMIDFVRSVGSFSLKKPFPMNDLLGLLVIAEVRGKHRSVFESGPDAQAEPPAGQKIPERATPRNPEVCLAPAPPSPAQSRAFAFAALFIFAIVSLALGREFVSAQRDVAAATAEQTEREAEWQQIEPQLDEALARRPQLAEAARFLEKLKTNRIAPRWTPALRGIAGTAGGVIELLEIHARENPKLPGMCEVHIHGWAGGSQPRQDADRFRQAFEETLQRDGRGRSASSRFDRLEDAPATPGAEQRIEFVIVAAVGAVNPPNAGGEGSSQ